MVKKAAGRSRATWTQEDVDMLHEAVAETRRKGLALNVAFERVARHRGSKPSAVQAKYYSMHGSGRRRGRSAAQAPDLTDHPIFVSQPADDNKANPAVGIQTLTTAELTKLIREATSELERRMSHLERNIRQMFG